MAMILGPISFGAFASHSSSPQSEQASASAQSNADRYQGLKPLNDSDLENIQGQGFDHTQAVLASLIQQVMHEDGSIELKLPSEIEDIAFKDLRVKGSGADRVFGDIVISDIKFSEHSNYSSSLIFILKNHHVFT
jgi:hypothetical protein